MGGSFLITMDKHSWLPTYNLLGVVRIRLKCFSLSLSLELCRGLLSIMKDMRIFLAIKDY